MTVSKDEKFFRALAFVCAATALFELLVSQGTVRMTRLSSVETTGLLLFAFLIFGLVSLFALTRMGVSLPGRLFAAAVSLLCAIMGLLYIYTLCKDPLFFRNLFFVLDRKSGEYIALSAGAKTVAVFPFAAVCAGAAIFALSGLLVLTAGTAGAARKRG